VSGMRIHGAAAPPRGPSPSGQPSAVDLLSHPALGQEGHLVLGHGRLEVPPKLQAHRLEVPPIDRPAVDWNLVVLKIALRQSQIAVQTFKTLLSAALRPIQQLILDLPASTMRVLLF
jgi:hypothetical protein